MFAFAYACVHGETLGAHTGPTPPPVFHVYGATAPCAVIDAGTRTPTCGIAGKHASTTGAAETVTAQVACSVPRVTTTDLGPSVLHCVVNVEVFPPVGGVSPPVQL